MSEMKSPCHDGFRAHLVVASGADDRLKRTHRDLPLPSQRGGASPREEGQGDAETPTDAVDDVLTRETLRAPPEHQED